MASKFGDLDLMGGIGKPAPGGKAAPKKSTGLLASKPEQLQAYLRDAVDASLSDNERAEALCQAIEFKGAPEAEEGAEDVAVLEDDGGY